MENMTPAEIKRFWIVMGISYLLCGAAWVITPNLLFGEERCVMRAAEEVDRIYGLSELSLPEAYAVPGAVEDMAERRAECEARYGG